jgi:hypothetical protein
MKEVVNTTERKVGRPKIRTQADYDAKEKIRQAKYKKQRHVDKVKKFLLELDTMEMTGARKAKIKKLIAKQMEDEVSVDDLAAEQYDNDINTFAEIIKAFQVEMKQQMKKVCLMLQDTYCQQVTYHDIFKKHCTIQKPIDFDDADD